ncbi:hypothetical protein BDV95DRAFT_72301 [Massariosphaeria phaeospora]|uniref:Uncharacterized protein n=1 Tax=Massariosphaeria phaeospora TaxID=100035 RepID=A0A7C8M7R1_9PLEO|nr:hypothetical protein BDV95DRAFT_72301 [Massariosphaeria phaeospora]
MELTGDMLQVAKKVNINKFQQMQLVEFYQTEVTTDRNAQLGDGLTSATSKGLIVAKSRRMLVTKVVKEANFIRGYEIYSYNGKGLVNKTEARRTQHVRIQGQQEESTNLSQHQPIIITNSKLTYSPESYIDMEKLVSVTPSTLVTVHGSVEASGFRELLKLQMQLTIEDLRTFDEKQEKEQKLRDQEPGDRQQVQETEAFQMPNCDEGNILARIQHPTEKMQEKEEFPEPNRDEQSVPAEESNATEKGETPSTKVEYEEGSEDGELVKADDSIKKEEDVDGHADVRGPAATQAAALAGEGSSESAVRDSGFVSENP